MQPSQRHSEPPGGGSISRSTQHATAMFTIRSIPEFQLSAPPRVATNADIKFPPYAAIGCVRLSRYLPMELSVFSPGADQQSVWHSYENRISSGRSSMRRWLAIALVAVPPMLALGATPAAACGGYGYGYGYGGCGCAPAGYGYYGYSYYRPAYSYGAFYGPYYGYSGPRVWGWGGRPWGWGRRW